MAVKQRENATAEQSSISFFPATDHFPTFDPTTELLSNDKLCTILSSSVLLAELLFSYFRIPCVLFPRRVEGLACLLHLLGVWLSYFHAEKEMGTFVMDTRGLGNEKGLIYIICNAENADLIHTP